MRDWKPSSKTGAVAGEPCSMVNLNAFDESTAIAIKSDSVGLGSRYVASIVMLVMTTEKS